MNFIKIIKSKILNLQPITKDEAILLVNYNPKEELYNLADEIRLHFKGNQFDMCSITNASSGLCKEDCKWCSQSTVFEAKVQQYETIDKEYAVNIALENANLGVHRYSLVTSGRGISKKNLEQMCEIYLAIKSKTNISLCASMGIIDKSKLEQLKSCGIVHYHCNLETSRTYFPYVCTTHTYDEKINTILNAKSLELKICSGGILGMGETMLDRIDMALELSKLEVDSIPLNILMPFAGTPLQNQQKLTDEEILTTFAIFRIINPKTDIRFAGGRMMIKHIENKALKAGINSALVGNLLTTIGSNVEEDKKIFTNAGFKL